MSRLSSFDLNNRKLIVGPPTSPFNGAVPSRRPGPGERHSCAFANRPLPAEIAEGGMHGCWANDGGNFVPVV